MGKFNAQVHEPNEAGDVLVNYTVGDQRFGYWFCAEASDCVTPRAAKRAALAFALALDAADRNTDRGAGADAFVLRNSLVYNGGTHRVAEWTVRNEPLDRDR